jgi:type II secretion system protein I
VRRTDSQQGFSLVEVLVALTIAAIGLAVVVAAIAAGARGARIAEGYSVAVWLAQDRLVQLENGEPRVHEAAGDYPRALGAYRWATQVTAVADDGDNPIKVYAAVVKVYFQVGRQEREVELRSLLGARAEISSQ